MSDDRITELYEAKIGTPASQLRARQRVHWMCSQVAGNEVLDIGCSQGIIAILLAREGKRVVGVDVDADALDFARQHLGEEEAEVQERVEFLHGDATELALDADSFDTVLLGEVLEHLLYPERVTAEAARVLRPGGRAVITVPYGLFRYSDHKEPIYLMPLIELVSADLKPVDIELIDHTYLGLVALGGETRIEPSVWRRALEVADEQLRDRDLSVDEQSASLKRQVEAVKKERERASGLAAELDAVKKAQIERVSGLETELDAVRKALTERVSGLEAELDALKRIQEERVSGLEAELGATREGNEA